MTLSKRVLLIVNPISGRRRSENGLVRLRDVLTREGFEVIERPTAAPGDARAMAAGAPDDLRAVLVYGGDGTVREIAEGLSGRGLPMYHLPVGNENLFAKHFGMSGRPDRVVAAVKRRQSRRIDLVEVNGAVCACCLGVGFDAEVVRVVTAQRRGHVSNWNYVGPIARTIFAYRFPQLEVQSEGRTVFSGRGMFFAGNLTRYAVGIGLFGKALDDDGLLDVVVFPCHNRRGFLKSLVLTLADRHYNHDGVISLRTANLKVIADGGVAVQVDGDVGPAMPIEARMRPGALDVLLPAD